MAKILSTELLFIAVFAVLHSSFAQDLAPPYFNIAEKKIVTVNATCGEGTITKKEVYCKLVGYDSYLHTQSHITSEIRDGQVSQNLIRGHT